MVLQFKRFHSKHLTVTRVIKSASPIIASRLELFTCETISRSRDDIKSSQRFYYILRRPSTTPAFPQNPATLSVSVSVSLSIFECSPTDHWSEGGMGNECFAAGHRS